MKYLVLLIPILLVSCKKDSNKVNQDKIYQSYEMTYDANSNYTIFIAKFTLNSENGNPLKLGTESSITINGETMYRSGDSYVKSFYGYLASGNFTFTNADEKSFSNLILAEDYIQNDATTHVGANGYWEFQGPALNYGETVSVSLNSKEEDGGSAFGIISDIGATYLKIPMNGIAAGYATALTKRSSQYSSGNWTSVGGKKKSEYIALPTIVQI